jgi:peptide/nickel transport system ATP-binding protein/oligopeptide transport system ATP-binding protein
MKLLEVRDLKTYFYTDDGTAKAVDGVSFSLKKGKVLGIVGESGCGKSVTSLSIMGLIDPVTGRNAGGHIFFHGQDLLEMKSRELQKIRGNQISMIFQEPMTSLNPVYTVGHQIDEAIMLHLGLNKKQARARTVDLLQKVGIPEARRRVDEYPHQLSGGMRQRVMIAMALSCNPELLIADEPTTALDVTIQAQILKLLRDIQQKLDMAIIIITHDLGVIAEMADEVAVMYAGQIVERAPREQLFNHPRHPYTQGLMGSIPDITIDVNRLQVLDGLVPSLYGMPDGCRFAPRCKFAEEKCRAGVIPLRTLESGAEHRCIGGSIDE